MGSKISKTILDTAMGLYDAGTMNAATLHEIEMLCDIAENGGEKLNQPEKVTIKEKEQS